VRAEFLKKHPKTVNLQEKGVGEGTKKIVGSLLDDQKKPNWLLNVITPKPFSEKE